MTIEELAARLAEEPGNQEIRLALAIAMLDAGRFEEAGDVCREILAADPGDSRARTILEELERDSVSGSLDRPPGVPQSRAGGSLMLSSVRDTLRGLPPPAIQRGPRDTLEQPTVMPEDDDDDGDDDEPTASSSAAWTTPSASVSMSLPIEDALLDETNPGASRVSNTRVHGDVGSDEDDPLALVRSFDRPLADALSAMRSRGGARGEAEGGRIEGDIFPDLPDVALAELAKGMNQREFAKGELILREGDPGDACFVLVHGSVRVLKRDPTNPRGDLIEVNRLRDGALFGEFALLADRRRHATVQAIEPTIVYEIPRRLLQRLASDYPEITPALERFYRERLLATLLCTAPFFRPLEPRLRADLLSRFQPLRVEPGERVVREGERAGGFYLIVLGSVEIVKELVERKQVLLASLSEGAYFGEMSLLRGDVARASVVATGPLELAMLAPRAFYDLVANHPILWEQIRQEAHRRELETHEIVAGLTGSS